MKKHLIEIRGPLIDQQTRCVHYAGETDRIAIKFFCCGTYFPCYKCHEEAGCGHPAVWPAEKFHEEAVLCGSCRSELTVRDYLECSYQCPVCGAEFNPGCGLHRKLYFSVQGDET